jgi:hypothetical protein
MKSSVRVQSPGEWVARRERAGIKDEDLTKFATEHPSLADFWQNCERSDWMIELLHATGYMNAPKLWKVFQHLSESTFKADIGGDTATWRARFYA